ncbi:MAG: NUDIX hydrolase [Coriobacteriia bacterium]|nr:NUDIX hydrolase [Coriobacteriia bacterium]
MNLEETKISEQPIFDGRVLHVSVHTVSLPNGNQTIRELVDHPGAVAVMVLDDQNNAFMVRQFRYALGEELLEVPAGKMDPGESALDAVRREQAEETGTAAETYVDLGVMYPTVAYTNERIYLFACRATGQLHQLDLDEDEFLEVTRVPLDQLERMVLTNELPDAKTQICVLKTAQLVREGKL